MSLTSISRWLFIPFIIFIFYSCEKQFSGGGFGYNVTSDGIGVVAGSAQFGKIIENPFIKTVDSATSTFSVDADGASYATMRKWTNQFSDVSRIRDAFRVEEFINYFTYNYPDPSGDLPIGVNGEVSRCPWNDAHKLIRIGIKGRSITPDRFPLANFVLLVDVSGSMGTDDKLDLLIKGFVEFAKGMRPQDKMAIVVYAGKAGLVLNATPGTQKNKIIEKLFSLKSGGSTNGSGGINLAYQIAEENFIPGGNNRVILGTDGDFNVGVTTKDELIGLIEGKRDKGIFLTTLGVGTDNLNEGMMEQLANKGNGNYEYLDDAKELKKVFVDEYGKFLTVAKDVKVQVTFNPQVVEEYRLIGYENRALEKEDFVNDKKDAGEIGAGQTITAIYEIRPKAIFDYKLYPTFMIDFRYKKPGESQSNPLSVDIFDEGKSFENTSENLRFAASLAALGLYLRDSEYKGNMTLADIKTWAQNAKSFDPNGYRAKHLELLGKLK